MCRTRPMLALPPRPRARVSGEYRRPSPASRLEAPMQPRQQTECVPVAGLPSWEASSGPGDDTAGSSSLSGRRPRTPVGEWVSGSWSWPRGRQVSVRPPGPRGGHPHPRGVIGGAADHRPVYRYVQHYGLGEACDDIASVLKRVAVKLRKTQKVKVLTGTGETWWPQAGLRGRSFWGRGSRSGLGLGAGCAGRPHPLPVASGGSSFPNVQRRRPPERA